MNTKVFGIGFHKTGTSTLAECLKTLGYSVCPEEYGYLLCDAVSHGDYRIATVLARFYDAFEDSPWNYRGFYRVLDAVFDAKFVLTVRDGGRWFDSLLRWCAVKGVGNSLHMGATIGVEVRVDNRQQIIDAYHQSIEEAKAFFADKPGRLLMIDWESGDGWDKLCTFLGRPIPDAKLPHALRYNRTTATWAN